ncbi:MAG: glycoside hydrolase family 36 protein [Chloroflexia bacterium]
MAALALRPSAGVSPAEPYLHLHAGDGLFSVAVPGGVSLLRDCRAGVELADGRVYTTEGPLVECFLDAAGAHVRAPGDDLSPELCWTIALDEDGHSLRLWLELENTTPHSLAIERLQVLATPSGFRQVPASDLEIAQTGWQSWSRANPPVPPSQAGLTNPPPVIGPMLPPMPEDSAIMPWMTLLRAPGSHSLLAGFTSAIDQPGLITLRPGPDGGHECIASSYLEGMGIPPGGVVRSETLLLVFDRDDAAALDTYARDLAETMGARTWSGVPTGWCSWYYFFTEVSEEDVIRNLAYLTAERHRMPVKYVQLDDGYQAHIGDWLTLNEKFPSGMRFLTDAIRSHGYKPGLWFAPFLVSEFSQVYTQHPDWVLRDEQGEPINAIHNWHTHNYALDITHPDAAEWLRHVVQTMVEEWGYDYLKIDFIYAGALRGVRYDDSCTSIQAYRRGLQIIRDAADDRFILGCGAPFAPSVGLVDGMRIGPDVAPFWCDPNDVFGSAPSMRNAVRSTLAHTWMHRRLWVNDPDCLLVRERNSDLTLPEVQSWTSIVGMTGGMALLSDDLSRLEPDRAAYVPLVFPVLGESATPLGPCVDGTPTRLRLVVERDWERWLQAALFNWTAEPQPLIFDPADWAVPEIASGPYHLYDLWTSEHLGPCYGPVTFSPTQSHGARQLSVHPHLNRPQLVGSTLHLLGGAAELTAERWSDNTLHLTLDCPGEHHGYLVIYVPQGYTHQPSGDLATGTIKQGNLLRVPVHLREQTSLALDFSPPG